MCVCVCGGGGYRNSRQEVVDTSRKRVSIIACPRYCELTEFRSCVEVEVDVLGSCP